MQSTKIIVNEKPFVCWDWELKKKNLEFLNGIDSEYFKYIAENNIDKLEGDNKHHAAISIRLAYSHGLETLFSLLSSVVQAPQCSIGWILSYRNYDLINLVKKITNQEVVYSPLKISKISWIEIANLIFDNLDCEDEKKKWIKKGFGKFWSLMASEFINERFDLEYNGIKHGLRITPGGFNLAFGKEEKPGIPVPLEKMTSLGGSIYGSSYYVKENIVPKDKLNFRPKHHARNWNPVSMAKSLILISMSINNVVNWLKKLNGSKTEKCKYTHPITKEDFENFSEVTLGIIDISFDVDIHKDDIKSFTKETILKPFKQKNI